MERNDLEGLVRRVVTQVVEKLESSPHPVTAPRREDSNPLGPPKQPAEAPASGSTSGADASAGTAAAPVRRDLCVVIGSDHGGYKLKELLIPRLHGIGYAVIDVGTHSTEAVDYPDFARAVAERVARGEADRGIVIDGAGIGSAMVANKYRGVRAAVCHDVKSVLNSRDHNDANVLSLGSGVVTPELAAEMAETWLKTPFGGGRHARRVAKIRELDGERP